MSHDKHQAFFDQMAAEWDLMFTSVDMEFLSYIVDKLPVAQGMDILDLGCGTGVLFDLLRRRVTDTGSIIGVDFSLEMTRLAHRNFPFANVNVVRTDALMLPFADSTFDMAVVFAAFPHFTDQQKAIDEVHRVLKNKASFFIIHLDSSREISEIHKKIGGVVENDEMPNSDKMREMFDSNRFINVTIEDRPGLYFASATNLKRSQIPKS
ncbi:MAG: class I SAM-dependent methyltransferase [candidate division Zixibacteria bacterium]|nr:class I SAM-dependent methyltransferase [candidate division Zixibacteria bacterium]